MMRLPVNQAQPSAQDLRVMEAVFGTSGQSSASRLIIPGVAFFVLSLPFVDKFLKEKIAASDIVLLVVKTGLFLAIMLVAQLFGWV
jgi:hypothetical protein